MSSIRYQLSYIGGHPASPEKYAPTGSVGCGAVADEFWGATEGDL